MMRAMMKGTANGCSALLIAAGFVLCLCGPGHAIEGSEQEMIATAAAAEKTANAEIAGKPVALNKFARRRGRHARHATRHRRSRVVARGYRRKVVEAKAVAMTEADKAAIPKTVAEAKAQWPAPNAAVAPVSAESGSNRPLSQESVGKESVSTESGNAPAASSGVVAADQLNDLDRNLSDAPTGADAASQIATQMASQIAQTPSQVAANDLPTLATPAKPAETPAATDAPVVAAGSDDSAPGHSSLIGKIFLAFGGLLTMASAARMFMA